MSTATAAAAVLTAVVTAVTGVSTAATRPARAADAVRFTERVSLTSTGRQVRGEEQFWSLSVSAGGRFVAFDSRNANLVPGDTNGAEDVFVRDRLLGTTERVSVTSQGRQVKGPSYLADLSGNGRYVLFNSGGNVYVRDLDRDVTIPVSVNRRGVKVGGSAGDISYDGRYVTFGSAGTALAPGNTEHYDQLFRRDMWLHRTVELTKTRSGRQGNGSSFAIHQLASGRRVMFVTYARNLVPNSRQGIVVRNVLTGETHLVVKRPKEQGDSLRTFDVSADGNIVAFRRLLTLPSGQTKFAVYAKDRRTGATRLISATNSGGPLNFYCDYPSVSADGRFVSFVTYRYVPVGGGYPPREVYGQIYIRDLSRGHTILASVSTAGTRGSSGSWAARLAGDGKYIAFFSDADNLVPNDTNNFEDAFLRQFR